MEQLIMLLELDAPDHNGVIFPTHVVEDAVQKFNKRVEDAGGVLGECGRVETGEDGFANRDRYLSIDLTRVSHIVKHMWIDNAILKAKVKLLGKYAEIAEQLGVEFAAIPRAFGEIDNNVCNEYTIVTVDLELPPGI